MASYGHLRAFPVRLFNFDGKHSRGYSSRIFSIDKSMCRPSSEFTLSAILILIRAQGIQYRLFTDKHFPTLIRILKQILEHLEINATCTAIQQNNDETCVKLPVTPDNIQDNTDTCPKLPLVPEDTQDLYPRLNSGQRGVECYHACPFLIQV
jgi:hypothetical protein